MATFMQNLHLNRLAAQCANPGQKAASLVQGGQAPTLRDKLLKLLGESPRGFPTWWSKERLNDGTTNAQARKEFDKLEKEGLVKRRWDSGPNNTIWLLAEAETEGR